MRQGDAAHDSDLAMNPNAQANLLAPFAATILNFRAESLSRRALEKPGSTKSAGIYRRADAKYNKTVNGGRATMNSGRDPRRYREEAGEFRKLAEAATDSQELRDSYLALALQYERLAILLEKAASGVVSPTSSSGAARGTG